MSALHETLVDLFNETEKLVHLHIRPIFRSRNFPFPPATMMLVHFISHEPGITVSELARRAQIAKSHVSNILEEMSQRGLIEKRQDPDDQRLVRIYLTERAAEEMQKMREEIRRRLMEVVTILPDEQVAQIISALQLFKEAFITHEQPGTSRNSNDPK